MRTRRIAAATTAAALTAPTTALAAAHPAATAHPSATPLLLELAAAGLVALVLLARRPAAKTLRTARTQLAQRRAHRRPSRHAY